MLDNAVKFTIKGSVEINCLMNKNEIALSFTDTGIGIPQELQKKVFEPFRQVETGMCRTFGGNGLGLPIVKAYIELLNGTVTLKSELEKGTNITVCIPLLQTSSLPLPENVIHQTTAVHTILIAEDEYSNYAYLKELLSSLNFKIVYAENGLKAVELCQSIPEIDLVLMDIKMPIMDGLTAAKKIREFRPELLILAQTAYALESEKDSCMYLFNDYITKPIKLDLLTEKLQKYLNK